jgi:hypothetical protein
MSALGRLGRWALLGVWLSVGAACMSSEARPLPMAAAPLQAKRVAVAPIASPTDPLSPRPPHTPAEIPAAPLPQDPSAAREAARGAVAQGVDGGRTWLALREGPGFPVGAYLVGRAEGRAEQMLRSTLPAARYQASQSVQLGVHAGELYGLYPLPDRALGQTPKNPERGKHFAGPGSLILLYPKAQVTLKVQLYDEVGRMRPEAYQELSRALYDPRLFALLYRVSHYFGEPIEVVSAFRYPHAKGDVDSKHARGRAVDIAVKGVSKRKLLAFLDSTFDNVGVGFYPNNEFVHLDVRGSPYYWTDPSGPGQRKRERERAPSQRARRGSDPTCKTVHLYRKGAKPVEVCPPEPGVDARPASEHPTEEPP